MITKIEDPDRKEKICLEILDALPEWFEIPESRISYARSCRSLPFLADEDGSEIRGFIALKETGRYTAEIYVTGVKKEYQRQGIGGNLFNAFLTYAREKGYEFIQVKTVREGMYPDYDLTNRFYQKIGFREFECMETLWDEANPCQVYVMSIR